MDLIKIANYIRQNASADYQTKVTELQDGDPIVKLSNPILQYSTVKNEFAKGLINVIGETIINRIAKFENPLAKFKRGGKGLGIDTREIAKGLVSGFNYEFTTGKLRGLNFSDIYFSAMRDINGNFEDSIIKSNEVLNMIGKVIPVTLDEMKIVAELANGYIVDERSKIPEIVSEKITKINRILINPTNCRPAPGVIEAIKKADCIVIGPGSLYNRQEKGRGGSGTGGSVDQQTSCQNCKRRRRILSGRYEFY